MQLLIRWAIASGALYAAVWILAQFGLAKPEASNWFSWAVAGLIMGLVNALIRPALQLLTAPLNCLTFGLVGGLINALMFFLIGAFSEAAGFPVFETSFWGSVLGAFLVALITSVANNLLAPENDKKKGQKNNDRDRR